MTRSNQPNQPTLTYFLLLAVVLSGLKDLPVSGLVWDGCLFTYYPITPLEEVGVSIENVTVYMIHSLVVLRHFRTCFTTWFPGRTRGLWTFS